MVMTKYALAPEGTTVELVDPRHGVKTASGLTSGTRQFLDALEPHPEYTYALVNAMGYSEYFGANSNTDWYGYNPHLDFNGLIHAPEHFGVDPAVDKMQGPAWPYGYPTYYGATVFAHHKNEDPAKLGFGDVIHVGTQEEMKRVELVMRIFNSEAEKKGHLPAIEKIRRGERTDVSMGCRIPFDLCSICTDWPTVKLAMAAYNPKEHKHLGIAVLAHHKLVAPIRGLAITKKDYCQCMLERRGKILPDGRKVFVYNDFPRFFDISLVWIGADRTARVMWFMSHSKRQDYTPAPVVSPLLKTASFKLGEMDKSIPGGIVEAVVSRADEEPAIESAVLDAMRSHGGARATLSSLATLGIVLRPEEFQRLVLPDMPASQEILNRIGKPVTFSTQHSGISNAYAVTPGMAEKKLVSVAAGLRPMRSSFAPCLAERALTDTKLASAVVRLKPHDALTKIAAAYNGYRLSVLEQAPELFEKSAELLGEEVSIAGLLRGVGTVLHLVASHLHRDAGTNEDMRILASTRAALPEVGTALRGAMSDGSCAGIPGAVRRVVALSRPL